jgi:membrane fusion protein (multidrug efflux system)
MPIFSNRPEGAARHAPRRLCLRLLLDLLPAARGRLRRLLARPAFLACLAAGLTLAAAGFSPSLAAEKLECMVAPYLEVKVSAAVSGVLEEVQVDRGDFVKKGQVLATLRSGVEKASYDLAKAKVAFADRKVQRNKELYKKQMISIHEKDELETDLELLKLEAREAEERLKERTILSPLNGVVTKRYFSPGEYVDIQQNPVISLAQIDPLRVEVAVPVEMYGKIKVGMTGQVEWEDPIGTVHPATVTVVDPVLDAASGTIGVRLELPNPRHQLPAGTKCTVTFPVAAADASAGKKQAK